ncbi:hypothetical protein J2Y45_003111 [Dyadobacter sp. BE34]|uniref:Uncharacterized protein n=1 Tax=Dyadobacter fermentans TaxID=94254 RepID=A0ABU1QWA7_9BACT|nr:MULTISPECIES: hypothetical protein [Dyadobacter]MDR7043660.1 hypothetical protein [Dyadobacter sp. BE242]MDR6804580.1 hypothetical protein [Dyadobacter fermentans]MDR7197972.1 hypothetical protein [Dyadobacter sp. BE34]MDR7214594.1 hypothetical protein [Dyadobacter sp. BE31]MDR7262129.1 hypothetical protein [Dyadobacter sp. BE32]
MRLINPWINFNGNAEEAFIFLQINFRPRVYKDRRFLGLGQRRIPFPESDEIMTIVFAERQTQRLDMQR